jgi:hypothetical protein
MMRTLVDTGAELVMVMSTVLTSLCICMSPTCHYQYISMLIFSLSVSQFTSLVPALTLP